MCKTQLHDIVMTFMIFKQKLRKKEKRTEDFPYNKFPKDREVGKKI